MRAEARRLFDLAVAAADPGPAVGRWLDENWQGDAAAVLALGKAAPAMMRAALERAPARRALCVTHAENREPAGGADILYGEHPVPGPGSAAAGEALLAAVEGLAPGDRVLALISGGGSALAVAPVEGVSLEDKAEVSRLLLGAGLDIGAMNLVRQNLSRIKGGGLARAAAPARVTSLVLSDVIGDDLAVIASGPTVPPAGSPAEAAALLRTADLWEAAPASVRAALARPAPPPPPAGQAVIVGSNKVSLQAMAAAGGTIVNDALTGDVAEAARAIAAAARPGVWLFGGETTVRLRGRGKGGRNQELALRVALELEGLGRPWAFLSGGTDGRDGPTDAAGGLVDDGTLARLAARGIDPLAALAENDSYTALAASGDLLVTGATGTNVADVQILIVQ